MPLARLGILWIVFDGQLKFRLGFGPVPLPQEGMPGQRQMPFAQSVVLSQSEFGDSFRLRQHGPLRVRDDRAPAPGLSQRRLREREVRVGFNRGLEVLRRLGKFRAGVLLVIGAANIVEVIGNRVCAALAELRVGCQTATDC